MAEIATVARPYAEAAFHSALEAKALAADAEALAFAAATARDATVRAVLSDPRVTAQQKKDLFAAVVAERLTPRVKNLLSIVVDAHRQELIESIAQQFDALKHDHERVVRARITSAQPLTDPQRDEIVSTLERQYGRKVEAEVEVDPHLLGGARVQVGDQVINASVRDALAQMAAALTR